MTGDLPLALRGQSLSMLPERAVYWTEAATLVVADTHWGKTATFRAAGLPVPRGTTAEGLARLDAALDRTGASRLLVLGDLLHAREGRAPEMLRMIADWRERRSSLDVVLVRGNHDRHAGDPPPELRIDCREGPLLEPPFSFDHYQRPVEGTYLLSGHVHPSVRLAGRGRQRARLPCFWFRPHVAILPAFGGFTGSADVSPTPADRLFVVADRMVVEIGLQS
ncbi:MAG: ligase-associated DNA damage response endonuclease PdeM [Gemmatimonadota bacterium]